MIALIPATIVAALVGMDGVNALLVASQFILSLVLPFVVLPLVYITSNARLMSVTVYEVQGIGQSTQKSGTQEKVDSPRSQIKDIDIEKVLSDSQQSTSSTAPPKKKSLEIDTRSPGRHAIGERGTKSFKNGRLLMLSGYVIFVCILTADIIAIISLASL